MPEWPPMGEEWNSWSRWRQSGESAGNTNRPLKNKSPPR